MKIDLTQKNPTIDASDLASALEITPAQVQDLMRTGAIIGRVETGVDEHAGTHRLTFWYDDLKVRYTCDADGTVVKTSRIKARRAP